jgi:hypothetical protein
LAGKKWREKMAGNPPGLPDGICIFKPKFHYLGKFWRVMQWKMLVYFMAVWYPFGD